MKGSTTEDAGNGGKGRGNGIGDGRDVGNPRETMRGLPGWMQPILTAITGKPLRGEKARVQWTGAGRFGQVLAGLAFGVAASAAAWQAGGAWLWALPLTWLITVWGARSVQTSLIHHGAHGTLFGSRRWTVAAGEILSIMLWILPFAEYERGHRPHHAATGTDRDVDLLFLKELGFRPGRTVEDYWRQLRGLVGSPAFHWAYFTARCQANFRTAPAWRRWLAAVWTLVVGGAWAWGGSWVMVAYLIPVLPLYHVAGLLQLLTEHTWVRVGEKVNPRKLVLARITHGRFLGEALPEGGFGVRLGWAFRMLFVHAVARLFAVQGDLPNHDFHHRHPQSPGWANAAFERRSDDEAGAPGWPAYTEVWGLGNALDLTFTALSRLPTDADLGQPLSYGEVADTVLTM